MKKVSHIVFRRMTQADFFNINKKPSATAGGGGQSYIDIDTSGVSIEDWYDFFSEIDVTWKKSGPLWKFKIHSLGLDTAQALEIGQRRGSSVNIRSQKLDSQRSNRVNAWHPKKTNFPSPKSDLINSSDSQIPNLIEGLVIFIIRATDKTYWAGWMKIHDIAKENFVPDALQPMLSKEDGFIRIDDDLHFDEAELNWPFRTLERPEGQKKLAKEPEFERAIPSSSKSLRFLKRSEEVEASDLFDADYATVDAKKKKVVKEIRERNQKSVRALKKLYGRCQISGLEFVFYKFDGEPYLEVHHVVPLGEGGADNPQNLIVVSAHIHRMLHFAKVGEINLSNISDNKLRIEINGKEHIIYWKPEHAATILDKKK